MSQEGARDAGRLSFADERAVNGLVSTGCFGISMEMIIMEAILKLGKKKGDIYVIYPTACLTVIIAYVWVHCFCSLFLI